MQEAEAAIIAAEKTVRLKVARELCVIMADRIAEAACAQVQEEMIREYAQGQSWALAQAIEQVLVVVRVPLSLTHMLFKLNEVAGVYDHIPPSRQIRVRTDAAKFQAEIGAKVAKAAIEYIERQAG